MEVDVFWEKKNFIKKIREPKRKEKFDIKKKQSQEWGDIFRGFFCSVSRG